MIVCLHCHISYIFAGLFEPNHMQYDIDRDTTSSGEPSLAEMTKTAIEILSKEDEEFFLLVEVMCFVLRV